MKIHLALGLITLLLAACGNVDHLTISPPGTPERACEDAADANPKIRNYNATTGVNGNPLDFEGDYKAARKAAVAECMRVRNGRPAGGVEKPIR